MPEFSDISAIGLGSALFITLVYYMAQRIGTKIGEDLYNFFKKLLLNVSKKLFFRKLQTTPAPNLTPLPTTKKDEIKNEIIEIVQNSPKITPPQSPINQNSFFNNKLINKPMFSTTLGNYFNLKFIVHGEIARIYSAELEIAPNTQLQAVILKIAGDASGSKLLKSEDSTLKILHDAAGAQNKHFPEILDRFRTAEGLMGLTFKPLTGFNLTQLRAKFSNGIEPRHVIWIFRRCLSALGMAHSKGILHGRITPDHIFIRPHDHNVWLIDWSYALHRPAETKQGFHHSLVPIYSPPEAQYGQAPLPSSDFYSLAKCIIFALGGDPKNETFIDTTPEPLMRILKFLLKESPLQRPQDAWELYKTLEKIRDDLFGAHRFVEFIVE